MFLELALENLEIVLHVIIATAKIFDASIISKDKLIKSFYSKLPGKLWE
jgi:hypothetical protein